MEKKSKTIRRIKQNKKLLLQSQNKKQKIGCFITKTRKKTHHRSQRQQKKRKRKSNAPILKKILLSIREVIQRVIQKHRTDKTDSCRDNRRTHCRRLSSRVPSLGNGRNRKHTLRPRRIGREYSKVCAHTVQAEKKSNSPRKCVYWNVYPPSIDTRVFRAGYSSEAKKQLHRPRENKAMLMTRSLLLRPPQS